MFLKKNGLITLVLVSLFLAACSSANDSDNSPEFGEDDFLGSWEQHTNGNVVGYFEVTDDMVIHISEEDGEYSSEDNYKLTEAEDNTIMLNQSNDELILEGEFQDEDTINMTDFQDATDEMLDENSFELVRVDNLDEELEKFYVSFENQDETTNNEDENIEEENESALDQLKLVVDNSEDTDEMHVTGDLIVGEDEDVKPGVYDLEVTGGQGNIMGERAGFNFLPINWAAGDKYNSGDFPSTIRIILLHEDTLKFSDISKVKFNAVSEDIEPSKELGIGQFIVGMDIKPGEYKLSSNV